MEHSLFTNRFLFSKIPSVFFDITNVVLGILSILVSAVLFTTSYKKLRCKFPVTVNCWFCNNNTKVPYDLSNSWDCPHCKQYNGFNKDGGYNKVIHEQYDNKLNEDVANILKKSSNKEKYNLQSNGFCKLCNINQELKVQQLALFVPIDENNYFEEIEQYREKLEKAYRLCSACEKTLKETLEKQEYNLLKNRLNDHKLNFSESLKNPIVYKYSFCTLLDTIKRIRLRGSRWLCIFFSALLFFASVFQYAIEHQLSHSELLNNVNFEPFHPVMEVISVHLSNIYKFRREISFFGLLCCVLSHSVRQGKISQLNISLWLLVHVLFWSNLTGFQILSCGSAVFLNVLGMSNKTIYLSKKSLKQNCSFRPEKRVFSEAYAPHSEEHSYSPNKNSPSRTMEKFPFNADTSDLIESRKLQEIKTKGFNSGESRLRNKKKEKNKENEIELVPDRNGEETRSEPDDSPSSPQTNSLNSSIFSKSFLSTLENQNKTKEERMEPLDEVDNNLGCLNLGRKHKKSRKPSNYLFASHNFSGKKSPASSSVIKPAKFIRNSSSSWTGTESNESASRSSTPSSGYSSQKIEKTEANRYEFPKTMTPLSVNPYSRPSPRDCFDYYEGNGSFYNNFNCFPQGFVPFQQFPGPLGHTTLYTYSRPANFPFSFPPPPPPPQAFPSNYKYSPTASTRFSDASDCDNLFQNASKSYENNRKWYKLKALAYNLSILLNLVTLVGFVSFCCVGIISVDWQLPKFNFFM